MFLRAIPARGGLSADARAGLVERPESWPPKVLHDDCAPGVREDEELAAALGIPLVPMSCPWADMAPVPVLGGAPAGTGAPSESGAPAAGGGAAPAESGDDESGPSLGFGIHCYPFGAAVLVLETTERLGDCTHVVGLAIFPKDGK